MLSKDLFSAVRRKKSRVLQIFKVVIVRYSTLNADSRDFEKMVCLGLLPIICTSRHT